MDYHIYNRLLSYHGCQQNQLYSNHQLQPRCLHQLVTYSDKLLAGFLFAHKYDIIPIYYFFRRKLCRYNEIRLRYNFLLCAISHHLHLKRLSRILG